MKTQRSNHQRRSNTPQRQGLPGVSVTVDFGNGESLTLNGLEMSPETIEWLYFDTTALLDQIRLAAERARKMVEGLDR